MSFGTYISFIDTPNQYYFFYHQSVVVMDDIQEM